MKLARNLCCVFAFFCVQSVAQITNAQVELEPGQYSFHFSAGSALTVGSVGICVDSSDPPLSWGKRSFASYTLQIIK